MGFIEVIFKICLSVFCVLFFIAFIPIFFMNVLLDMWLGVVKFMKKVKINFNQYILSK